MFVTFVRAFGPAVSQASTLGASVTDSCHATTSKGFRKILEKIVDELDDGYKMIFVVGVM